MRPPTSEKVDDQIDPNAQEGSHGTCQCHDQKGLVDHYTTPHNMTQLSRFNPSPQLSGPATLRPIRPQNSAKRAINARVLRPLRRRSHFALQHARCNPLGAPTWAASGKQLQLLFVLALGFARQLLDAVEGHLLGDN